VSATHTTPNTGNICWWEQVYYSTVSSPILAILLLLPALPQLKASGTGTYGPSVDFERDYAQPTITSIAPFDLMLGQPPKIHIHIQHGRTQYVCTSNSSLPFKKAGLEAGTKVDIREQTGYVQVRKVGQKIWLKLRLISKTTLGNL